jgi:tetratricopeptide (TPR) repeat protein
LFGVLLGVLLLGLGCAALPPEPATPLTQEPEFRAPPPSQEPTDTIQGPAPRTVASFKLTEQAQYLISTNKPDEAIRILERSLNIDPNNGLTYYYLAEAWILKGDKIQAIEFNRLAGIYLGEDAVWLDKVRIQKEHIENMDKK